MIKFDGEPEVETPVAEPADEGRSNIVEDAFVGLPFGGEPGQPMPGLLETPEEAQARAEQTAGNILTAGLLGAGAAPKAFSAAATGVKTLASVSKAGKIENEISKLKLQQTHPGLTAREAEKVIAKVNNKKLNEIVKDITTMPSKLRAIKSVLFSSQFQFASAIALWYSADNLPTVANLRSRDARQDVKFGNITPAEGLEQVRYWKKIAEVGRAGTIGAMAVNPVLIPVGMFFLKGTNANIRGIESDEQFILGSEVNTVDGGETNG
ncbi:hypothetical protein LCGC14_2804200 [marine sediment metagenome]|uniref:Uncharacterized protein n=1 Tax=marine sediment metagenome TaxID=412755 RepID=A0A0F8YLX7_9ZZZZ